LNLLWLLSFFQEKESDKFDLEIGAIASRQKVNSENII